MWNRRTGRIVDTLVLQENSVRIKVAALMTTHQTLSGVSNLFQ